jgi:hypothetical protein
MYFYPNCVVNISAASVDLEEAEYAVVHKSSKGNKGINRIYGILLKVALNTINLKNQKPIQWYCGLYGSVYSSAVSTSFRHRCCLI